VSDQDWNPWWPFRWLFVAFGVVYGTIIVLRVVLHLW